MFGKTIHESTRNVRHSIFFVPLRVIWWIVFPLARDWMNPNPTRIASRVVATHDYPSTNLGFTSKFPAAFGNNG